MFHYKKIGKFLTAPMIWLGLTLLFNLSHTKWILYGSNENTKLLPGIAAASHDALSKDWLVHTIDPLPFFSYFVKFSYQFMGEVSFYLYFFILLGIFVYSMLNIFSEPAYLGRNKLKQLILFTSLVFFYSAFLGQVSKLLFNVDLLSMATTGLSQQYLLHIYFQNSLFGIFLILSILMYLRNRIYWAGICLALTATVHSAYLFSSMCFCVGYMVDLYRKDKTLKRPLYLGLLTLGLVLPTFIYNKIIFSPTTAEQWQAAMNILVNRRIPHHTHPSYWLEPFSAIKGLIMLGGLFVTRKTPLFIIMGVPFLIASFFTVIQILTGSLELALVGPWRVSVFLVPLSLFAIISTLINKMDTEGAHALLKKYRTLIKGGCLAVIAGCALGGGYQQLYMIYRTKTSAETQLFNYVKAHHSENDLYMLHPQENNLECFRLKTHSPIVINVKSHPYKDVEILEWTHRNHNVLTFYKALSQPKAAQKILKKLRQYYPITHVLVSHREAEWLVLEGAERVFSNQKYDLYAFKSAQLQKSQ